MKFLRWAYRIVKICVFIAAFFSWAVCLGGHHGSSKGAFVTLFVFCMIDIGVFLLDMALDRYSMHFMDLGAMAICKFIQVFIFVWLMKRGTDVSGLVFLIWSGALDIYIFVEKLRNKL